MGFLFIIVRYAPSSAVPPLCFNVYVSDANVVILEHLELLLLAWFIHLHGFPFSLYSWRLRVLLNDWKGDVLSLLTGLFMSTWFPSCIFCFLHNLLYSLISALLLLFSSKECFLSKHLVSPLF